MVPAARAGIFGAIILALGRALGETIATTMVDVYKRQEYFRAIRQRVITFLRTYSFARIWRCV